MRYLYSLSGLLSRCRAVFSAVGLSEQTAFRAPDAFYEEIREDRRNRDLVRPVEETGAEDERTMPFKLPEDWDDDATAASYEIGSALLRGEIGIDTLTEVKITPEHIAEPPRAPVVRAAPGRYAKRRQSKLLGLADHPINRIDELLPWAVASQINQNLAEARLAA